MRHKLPQPPFCDRLPPVRSDILDLPQQHHLLGIKGLNTPAVRDVPHLSLYTTIFLQFPNLSFFFNNPSCPVCGIHMHVGPSTGVCMTFRIHSEKNGSPSPRGYQLCTAPQLGVKACEALPSPYYNVDWIGHVPVSIVTVSS